ncbi:MAG: DUF1501 domain-containing protein [Chloroflexota bacterium]|nr:DUF1501 domain-containing protein [Chloroflexota bacterium]
MKITRRQFLVGCSAAIAATAGARLTQVAFASPDAIASPNEEILVVVFLRGGWDALNVVPPIDGADRGFYEHARATLKIPAQGANPALRLNAQFGLHPALAPLHDLYQARKLAVVHAVGMNADTRSHFDAMEYIERGTPGAKSTTTGWLTRHLATAPNLPSSILMPALSAASQPTALLGSPNAVAMSTPSDFSLDDDGDQRAVLRKLYRGDSWLHQAGAQTLHAIEVIEKANPGEYTPTNGAEYPDGEFGDNLKTIAQMIKLNVGLQAVTVDLGGWDTHEHQGDGSIGYMAELLTQFAQGLRAFYTDLDGGADQDFANRLTVVVMSEFGRRLMENASHGTDHGHGSVMLALGGHINGGQVFGKWPSLRNDQLYERQDLAVTTDYRQVLSEILVRRLGNPNLSAVFPGYAGYQPLGIAQGTDMRVTA